MDESKHTLIHTLAVANNLLTGTYMLVILALTLLVEVVVRTQGTAV